MQLIGFLLSSFILTLRALLLWLSYPLPSDTSLLYIYMIVIQFGLCVLMNIVYFGVSLYLHLNDFGMKTFNIIGPDGALQYYYRVYQGMDTLLITDFQLMLSVLIVGFEVLCSE